MPLRGDYWEKYTNLANWAMAQSQSAKQAARRAVPQGKYVEAIRLIGFADWMEELHDILLTVRDDYNKYDWVVPQPGGDYRDRRQQMCSMAVTTAAAIYERGPYTPPTAGEASPVTEFWNAGAPTPAIYLAGRYEAAAKFYGEGLVPNFGWSRGGDPAAIPDPGRHTPFWGNVSGTKYPRAC